MSSNKIQVFARLKPAKRPTDKLRLEEDCVAVHTSENQDDGLHSKAPGLSYQFRFKKVFDTASTQDTIFDTVAQPITEKFIDGYNGTIFAYGQTGSGKTYTIEGSARRFNQRGLIPRVVSFIYETMEGRTEEDWRVEVSFMEVYQDTGYDLLNPGSQGSSLMVKLPKVKVQEGPDGGVLVRNLSTHLAANEEVAHNLLFQGSANRKVAETSMNLHSSRSHAIFSIMLTRQASGSDIIVKSKLNLVDLAGSERVAKSLADGRILKEAKHINLSLHHLEHVIVALQQKGRCTSSGHAPHSPYHTPPHPPSRQRREDSTSAMLPRQQSGSTLYSYSRARPPTRSHVPYRNCLLTMVLRDSLGGNCFTAMVATLSSEEINLGENISTCRFAQRVACVSNTVRRNEEMDDKVLIKKLKRRVAELEAEVEQLKGELTSPQQQPKAVSPNIKLAPASAPLSEGERKHCHQILYNYLHGKLDDPITAGMDDSRKVKECMEVMRNIVLHALGLGKGGAGVTPTSQSNGKSAPLLKNGHLKQHHISPDSSLGKAAQGTGCPIVTPASRNSSGFGSIADEDNSDTSPLHQSHGGYMQQSHDGHVTKKHPKLLFTHQVENTPNNAAMVKGVSKPIDGPQQSNRPEVHVPQIGRKTPQKHPTSKGGGDGGGGVLETKASRVVRSEDEKRKLVMNVQELQIKVKEEEIRTELDLTKEQLAHQHARVLSLQQRGAGEEEVCQERLAEQQLRLKQAKLFQQLLDIEHSLKLHHIADAHTTQSANMQENVPRGPKSPSGPITSTFERQLMAEVASHEKHQAKMDRQIDSLRVSQAEKQLQLREAATKRKLLALKQQQLNSSLSPTSEAAPPTSPCHTHCTPINSPPSTATSPQSPSHYQQIHSPPPTTSLESQPDSPTHSAEGGQRSSSTRNGMSALKARLMASQESNRSKPTASSSGGYGGRGEDVKGSVFPRSEGKEVEFMLAAQRQKERVERIRMAMHAAQVIQQAWRRYRLRVKGKM